MQQFTPTSDGHTLSMTGSSVNQALAATGAAASALYIANPGTSSVNIRWGSGAQTAVATDFTVLPGAYFVLGKGLADNVAAIGTSGGSLYICPGEGQ